MKLLGTDWIWSIYSVYKYLGCKLSAKGLRKVKIVVQVDIRSVPHESVVASCHDRITY